MPDQRLYRLIVEYPEGSQKWGWEPEGWSEHPMSESHDHPNDPDGRDYAPFSWPAAKTYMSRKGASGRANLLRKFGCRVRIEESEPVAWSGREVPVYGSATNTPWDNFPDDGWDETGARKAGVDRE